MTYRIFAALFGALLSWAAIAQPVTDFAGLQAAFVDNAEIEVRGAIYLPSSLTGAPRNVVIRGNGVLVAQTSAPIIVYSGQRLTIDGPTMWNEQGPGIRLISGAGGVRISRTQINTRGWGIAAENGAGLWLTDVHFNGLAPGTWSTAVVIGQWDTVFISGVLTEEHDVGLRAGFLGHSANILIGTMTIDRAVIGLQPDPTNGAVANLLAGSIWVACRANVGVYASGISASSASGAVSTVRVNSLYATGCPQALSSYGSFGGGGLSVGWRFPSN